MYTDYESDVELLQTRIFYQLIKYLTLYVIIMKQNNNHCELDSW